MAMGKVTLKLFVDKKKNRVVFAESDKDLVDILLSFLTLPMGTIVRLLGKQSAVGCLDRLYRSVDNLDTQYLQTEACKMMLLQPRSAAEKTCEGLAINADDLPPRRLYRCTNWDCFTKTHCTMSNVPGARCPCGLVMKRPRNLAWTKEEVDAASGVFVKGGSRFVISDDLHVTPLSIGTTMSLLQGLGIEDANQLQQKTVDLSRDKILRLLKRMLHSKTPLTDVFLRNRSSIDRDEGETGKFAPIKDAEGCDAAAKGSKMISVRLFESESTNKLVWAEAGEELVDILFSFLTFPLGSIVKILGKPCSLGCVDNLYQSVKVLSLADGDYIKSEECKNMLLDPKLAPHFCCSNQLLRIDEKPPRTCTIPLCEICFEDGIAKCTHGVEGRATITKQNPKLPIPSGEAGGGFARSSFKFMVTDDMTVTPLSADTGVDSLKKLGVPITSLVEREITCSETEVSLGEHQGFGPEMAGF